MTLFAESVIHADSVRSILLPHSIWQAVPDLVLGPAVEVEIRVVSAEIAVHIVNIATRHNQSRLLKIQDEVTR